MGINYLHGSMVPRAVTRQVDHRAEPRIDVEQTAVIWHRGRKHVVPLANLSASGAMLMFRLIPHIGETIRLRLGGHGDVSARVCWVKDGRIGVTFAEPLKGVE
jgi:hypothetical protein